MHVDIQCDNNNCVVLGKYCVLIDEIKASVLMNKGNQCGNTNIVFKEQARITQLANVLELFMDGVIHCCHTNYVVKGKDSVLKEENDASLR